MTIFDKLETHQLEQVSKVFVNQKSSDQLTSEYNGLIAGGKLSGEILGMKVHVNKMLPDNCFVFVNADDEVIKWVRIS